MVYDLGDAAKWEFFFPNVERALLVLPGEAPPIEMMESEESFTEVNRRKINIRTRVILAWPSYYWCIIF